MAFPQIVLCFRGRLSGIAGVEAVGTAKIGWKWYSELWHPGYQVSETSRTGNSISERKSNKISELFSNGGTGVLHKETKYYV